MKGRSGTAHAILLAMEPGAVDEGNDSRRIVILIPVFNDWQCASLLLASLDSELPHDSSSAFDVLLVDDGSTISAPRPLAPQRMTTVRRVDILHLRSNLGHQRAIAVGLVFVHEHMPCRAVVIMDGDGQDRPRDVPRLLAQFEAEKGRHVVFAQRGKRLESVVFRACYRLYRFVHLMLTGDPVRVGNFSVLPFDAVTKLIVQPEIWHHYAATVIRRRIEYSLVPTARGQRLAGKSQMSLVRLLMHGLTAFTVYADVVGARLLIGISAAVLLECLLLLAGFVAFSTGAIGLAGGISVIGAAALLQGITIAAVALFTIAGVRSGSNFLPVRDCPYFVSELENVFAETAQSFSSGLVQRSR
jgi:polyisoprenyl-phosphate glycosyltransferase